MAKQKLVLKLSMEDAKQRAKAMQCAVGVRGVISVSHEGNKLTVVGEGVDSVALTMLLRKKMRYAELEMLEEVKEKKEEKNDVKEVKSTFEPLTWPMGAIMQPPPFFVDVKDPFYDQSNCNIM